MATLHSTFTDTRRAAFNKNYVCNLCQSHPTFTTEYSLRDHAVEHHPSAINQWSSYLKDSAVKQHTTTRGRGIVPLTLPIQVKPANHDFPEVFISTDEDDIDRNISERVQILPFEAAGLDEALFRQRISSSPAAPEFGRITRIDDGLRLQTSRLPLAKSATYPADHYSNSQDIRTSHLAESQFETSDFVSSPQDLAHPDFGSIGTRKRLGGSISNSQQRERGILRISPANPQQKTASVAAVKNGEADDVYDEDSDDDLHLPERTAIILQPDTRPITYEQLMNDVKDIYTALVALEARCVELDAQQVKLVHDTAVEERTPLDREEWLSLIALHLNLLNEHQDFMLAIGHPTANPGLIRLAMQYKMPARFWRHGIHGFLEVLRLRLPESLEYMYLFVNSAYKVLSYLLDFCPKFEDIWIECMGDLSRYRFVIGSHDDQTRQTWLQVSHQWYQKALMKNPERGRFMHHLAIIAKPFSINQLSLYGRALTCLEPFQGARSNLLSFFKTLYASEGQLSQQLDPLEAELLKAHSTIFLGGTVQALNESTAALIGRPLTPKSGLFASVFGQMGSKFREVGAQVALANCALLMEYGAACEAGKPRSLLITLLRPTFANTGWPGNPVVGDPREQVGVHVLSPENKMRSMHCLRSSARLAFGMFLVAIGFRYEPDFMPFVHIYMVFIFATLRNKDTSILIAPSIPWAMLARYLNALLDQDQAPRGRLAMNSDDFPGSDFGTGLKAPLPEDFLMDGQIYARDYFPAKWIANSQTPADERSLDLPSMTLVRQTRILWLAIQMAKHCPGFMINYEPQSSVFICSSDAMMSGTETRYMMPRATTRLVSSSSSSSLSSESSPSFTPCFPDLSVPMSIASLQDSSDEFSQDQDPLADSVMNGEGTLERPAEFKKPASVSTATTRQMTPSSSRSSTGNTSFTASSRRKDRSRQASQQQNETLKPRAILKRPDR